MFSIKSCALPDNALLKTYQKNGAYTDCFTVEVSADINQSQYIHAFYSTAIFKLERIILKWVVSKPSSDQQVLLLANGEIDSFAVWDVEKRSENQLLMCDHFKRTRSWLMVEPIVCKNQSKKENGCKTRLYFGSAVVPLKHDQTGKPSFGFIFHALSLFHKLYSIALLYSAKSRLKKSHL